jgi:hypothetical protein
MEQTIKAQALDLFNICGGAVPEVFLRELQEVLENISDINTGAGKSRSIVLKFDFKPYPDRSAFSVSLQCKSGLASVEAIEGIAYLVKQIDDKGHTKVSAFARDIRQQSLFEDKDKPEAAPDGKTAATGEKVVGIDG